MDEHYNICYIIIIIYFHVVFPDVCECNFRVLIFTGNRVRFPVEAMFFWCTTVKYNILVHIL